MEQLAPSLHLRVGPVSVRAATPYCSFILGQQDGLASHGFSAGARSTRPWSVKEAGRAIAKWVTHSEYICSQMRRYAVMPQTRVVDWRGNHYRFERLELPLQPSQPETEWAVSRRGEFVGIMRSPPGEGTQEFELGAFHWLRALLGPAPLEHVAGPGP
jgi:hypothetical protein